MANIVVSDVTYTLLNKKVETGVTVNASLAFGNSVLTYPAGGVPISGGNLGLPNWIETLVVYSGGTGGLSWNYDRTNQKLIATQGAAHSHDFLLADNTAADATSARVVATNTGNIGSHTGANITVSGTQVSAFGGVRSATVGAQTEPSGSAIPAQTLLIVATGW